MILRRYQVCTFLTQRGKRVSDPRVRRKCFTQKNAKRWGESVTNNPETLAATLDSALRTPDGSMIFAEFEVIDLKEGKSIYDSARDR